MKRALQVAPELLKRRGLKRDWRGEERLVWKLVGKGSRRGATLPGRASDIVRSPLFWAGTSAALGLAGGRGRRAALRGSACYATAALIHLLIKPLVGRRHPRGGAVMQMGFGTSSFPSGHAASDLALTLGVSQELPLLFLPLSAATAGAHWALIRGREHYPSDVVAGGVIAVAVAAAAWILWPPGRDGTEEGNPRAEP